MVKRNDRWSQLSMKQRADLIKLYTDNGITSLDTIKRNYNSFAPGGPIETDEYGYPADITPAIVTQDSEFNKFLMTLPDNQRLTPEEDYHTYQYWKINGKPKDFSEALNLGMYHYDSSDNSYHANSVAFDSKGVGHFMKPKHHPTVKYELDWYNKGTGTLEGGEQYPLQGEERKEWEDFRSQYQLDSTGVDYKYVPRRHYNSFGDGGDKIPFTFNDFGNTFELSTEIPEIKGERDVPLPLRLESQKEEDVSYTPLTYKVKSGDSLSKIAKNQNVNIDRLIQLNPQLLERKGSINTIFIGEDLKIGDAPTQNDTKENEFEFVPIKENQRILNDYKDVPVSLLYRQTTGESWPPKSGIYADMYDGTKEGNLEIKQLLVDENNRKSVFKLTYDGKIKNLNKDQHVGIVKTENIENPSGIDYSSPESVPIYQRHKDSTSNLNKAFTFESMDDFSSQFVCDKECASTLTNRLMRTKNYDLIDKYNYRGSAWTILQNAEKQGVPIVNIYDELENKDLSKEQVINFAHKKSKDKEFQKQILEGLSAGNVVTLMNPNSSKFDTAKEESKGRVLSTHAGVIVDVGGKQYVAHSMAGTRKLTPVESLLQGKGMVITGIARYDLLENDEQDNYQTADLSAYGFNLQEDMLNRTDRISSISAYRAERSLHNNAEALRKHLYVSDEALQFTSEILPALMYRETSSGYLSSDTYRKTSAQSTVLHDAVRGIREAVTGVSESIGLTNVKLKDENEFFTPRDLNRLGLEGNLTKEQRESPELTGVLTAVNIDRRMRKLDKLLGKHKQEVPKDVYDALLIMSWSQGFDNIGTNIKRFIENGDLKELSQYKTFGDYTSIVQYLKYLGKDI